MFRGRLHVPAVAALMLFLFGSPSSADRLPGRVTDRTGAAVPGAIVTIMTAQRAVVATALTGADGSFAIDHLAPGQYLVSVARDAFEHALVAVTVGGSEQPATIVLDPATVREEVTVTASPGTVSDPSRTVQASTVITAEDLAVRAKTVIAQAFQEEAGLQLQTTSPTIGGVFVRGLTGNKVNVFVDGVRFSTSAARGGINTFLNLVDSAALDSIEVLRGPNSAEYGSDALGGSVQFLGRVPTIAAPGARRFGGEVSASATSAHVGGKAGVALSYSGPRVGLFGSASGQASGDIRTGGGFDSHAAVTRFFGLRSDEFVDGRLPDTSFHQSAAWLKGTWHASPATQVVAGYANSRQDGGKRYDQLLGGDGNLVASLADLGLDLFYGRVERMKLGWFDYVSATFSVNRQREERINQGGNGNPRATIGHEPETTLVRGFQANASKALSPALTASAGGDAYFERLVSDAYNVNPVTGAASPRRPRVPSGATYRQGGVYLQSTYAAVPDRLKLVGNVRWSAAKYEAHASDSPLVGNAPLWPDDALSASSLGARAGAVFTPSTPWIFSVTVSRGFRAPHMTDLGTLGITGSGFEVAAPDVAGRGAFVGTTAGAGAVSTGDPVEQVGPETSVSYEGSVRYRTSRVTAEFSVFANNIDGNIQKQALILPQGAVGTSIGGQVITQQTAGGAVFVAAATNPVLVRANFDRARVWGLETTIRAKLSTALSLDVVGTALRARDLDTDLAPNIEGGTPAPEMYLFLKYAASGGSWWVTPYGRLAARQTHLSTLDLEDRRTGAARTRASIRAFFLNGATARGWVVPGADGVLGTADDVLSASGETVAQIQDRVLGAGVTGSSLFTAVPGFATFGVRGGVRVGRHEVVVDASNLTDRNYRGISWGVDAPGRGVSVALVARF